MANDQFATPDKRILLLIVGFSFGALMEGIAGFGASIAIGSALLIGLGLPVIDALVLTPNFDTVPVAFGALGVPITTLATVTGLPAHALSAIVRRQLPLLGKLQVVAANKPHRSPMPMAATNPSGAVMSKVISPQNVTTGISTTSLNGKEGLVIRRTFLHGIVLAALLGLLAMAQQYLIPGVIPH